MPRSKYEHSLELLKLDLIHMANLTEVQIDDVICALEQNDIALAQKVTEGEERINELCDKIESSCLKIFLCEQPVAQDFRDVSSILKMITDLERIADQADDIAHIVQEFRGEDYIKELVHIPQMGKFACRMVKDSISAFAAGDVELAKKTIALDDEIDRLFGVVKSELCDKIRENASNADQAISLMMIAKYLERIGDHAVNICEWANYSMTGHK